MSRPSFVLIITDTQGANVVGCYGRPDLDTPNIDGLAARGVRFEHAYTACPLCTPARAALFTGIAAHTSGAWTNNLPLGQNVLTMGQRFRDQGYRTAYVGKWHLDGHDYFGTGACPDGWEEAYWYDGRRYLDELSTDEILLWRRGLDSIAALRAHNVRPEFTWAHRISDRAVRFLQEHDGSPFLLVASYDEPHHPFTCPPEYAERFADYWYDLGPGGRDDLADKPAHQREWAAAEAVETRNGHVRHPLYLGCNAYVDREIGRVIDAARAHGPEDTYIIYTSDHGDMLGAHGLRGKGPVMYEEITRVPLIVEAPTATRGASVNPTPVSHLDLLPTMLSLAGIAVPPIMHGEDITPLLEGHSEPDRAVALEFNRYEIEHDSWGGFQPVRCLVRGRHKLVINLLHTDELYDLAQDPGEVHNRIADPEYAEIRDALHERLLETMYAQRDPFRGPAWERRPWQKARRLQWRGLFRPRPGDGYAPEVRDYDTGLPTRGPKVEHGKPTEKA